MRIIYAGTPEFAVPALEGLALSNHQIVAVYTQPDRPAGRGRQLHMSAVKTTALQYGLTVVQPESFKHQQDSDRLQSFSADLMVVAAYGILLPQVILDAPRLGCINIHASLLPRWRGAAPIQRAILAGDRQTGITLMQMDAGLDTGKMLAQSTIDIHPDTTAAACHDELKQLGSDLLLGHLDGIENATLEAHRQDDSTACYAKKLTKREAEIDWKKSAVILHREIRAFNPWPVSFTSLNGQNVKIWSACLNSRDCSQSPGQVISHTREAIQVCCGSSVLSISELQFAGKKRMSADQLLNSRNLANECFGH